MQELVPTWSGSASTVAIVTRVSPDPSTSRFPNALRESDLELPPLNQNRESLDVSLVYNDNMVWSARHDLRLPGPMSVWPTNTYTRAIRSVCISMHPSTDPGFLCQSTRGHQWYPNFGISRFHAATMRWALYVFCLLPGLAPSSSSKGHAIARREYLEYPSEPDSCMKVKAEYWRDMTKCPSFCATGAQNRP